MKKKKQTNKRIEIRLPLEFIQRAKILAKKSKTKSVNAWLSMFLQANEPGGPWTWITSKTSIF